MSSPSLHRLWFRALQAFSNQIQLPLSQGSRLVPFSECDLHLSLQAAESSSLPSLQSLRLLQSSALRMHLEPSLHGKRLVPLQLEVMFLSSPKPLAFPCSALIACCPELHEESSSSQPSGHVWYPSQTRPQLYGKPGHGA